MRADPALREIVGLMRAANAGDADALHRLGLQAAAFEHSRAPLDSDEAVRELLDLRAHVGPELRYALARWISGRIALKRGRKRMSVLNVTKKARRAPRRAPLDGALCIRALLDFGSAAHPFGVLPNTRIAIADLLTGARKLKTGPHLDVPRGLRTLFAVHAAHLYAAQATPGRVSMRKAINRAAAEAGIKPGTLQRAMYPRRKMR